MSEKKKHFYVTHYWMIKNMCFSNGAESTVFAFIYGLNQSGLIFRGSAAFLAQLSVCSVSTIRRAVKSLVAKNYISVRYGKCHKGKCWIIKPIVFENYFEYSPSDDIDEEDYYFNL